MRQAAKRTTVITAATSLGFAVVQLDGSILNVALPRIGAALGASVDTLQWTVDAYFLVFAALLLSAGALGDRIGSKRAFIAGFTIFAAASCACGLASTPLALIAFRAMQGVGGALLVPCSLALINFAVETDRPAIRRGIDPAGQILAIIFLIALVWAVIEAGSFGLTAPRVIVGFIVAALAACLLLVVERHAKDPAIPLSFFQDTTFSAATFGGFVVSVVLFGLAFGMTLYFQRMLSYTPAEAGLAFVPFAIGITVSNLTGGWLSAKAGARLPIVSGLLLAAAGAMLLTGLGPDTAYLSMLPAQLMVRFGAGLAMPPMTAALLSTVPRARSGSASGLLNAIRQSGAAIGIALYGALMRGNMIEGLRIAVVISAVLFAAAATAAVFGIRARDPGVSLTGREVKAN